MLSREYETRKGIRIQTIRFGWWRDALLDVNS